MPASGRNAEGARDLKALTIEQSTNNRAAQAMALNTMDGRPLSNRRRNRRKPPLGQPVDTASSPITAFIAKLIQAHDAVWEINSPNMSLRSLEEAICRHSFLSPRAGEPRTVDDALQESHYVAI